MPSALTARKHPVPAAVKWGSLTWPRVGEFEVAARDLKGENPSPGLRRFDGMDLDSARPFGVVHVAKIAEAIVKSKLQAAVGATAADVGTFKISASSSMASILK